MIFFINKTKTFYIFSSFKQKFNYIIELENLH